MKVKLIEFTNITFSLWKTYNRNSKKIVGCILRVMLPVVRFHYFLKNSNNTVLYKYNSRKCLSKLPPKYFDKRGIFMILKFKTVI